MEYETPTGQFGPTYPRLPNLDKWRRKAADDALVHPATIHRITPHFRRSPGVCAPWVGGGLPRTPLRGAFNHIARFTPLPRLL